MSALLRLTNRIPSPFLRTLLPSIGLAYALQAAVAAPSTAFQTERFYDLSGSLTYISCTALSLYLPTLRARYASSLAGAATKPAWPSFAEALRGTASVGGAGAGAWNWRMLALSACVGIWAGRLGTYLFARITTEKKDSRFDEMRTKPLAFGVAFLAQATARSSLSILSFPWHSPLSGLLFWRRRKKREETLLTLRARCSGYPSAPFPYWQSTASHPPRRSPRAACCPPTCSAWGCSCSGSCSRSWPTGRSPRGRRRSAKRSTARSSSRRAYGGRAGTRTTSAR